MNTGTLQTMEKRPLDRLNPLLAQIREEARLNRDFRVDPRTMHVSTTAPISRPEDDPDSWVHVEDAGRFAVRPRAHRHLGGFLDMPMKFYERLRVGHPELFDPLVNGLLNKSFKARMVRTRNNAIRAILSDRYRRRDNYDLIQHILPVLEELEGEIFPVSASVTDAKLYLKIVYPDVQREIKKGDVVRAGFVISNSEVGEGQTEISGFVERMVCSNGMILPQWSMGRRHIGRRITGDGGDDNFEIFSDETKAADDHAFFLAIRDAVRAVGEDTNEFDKAVKRMQGSAQLEIEADPIEAVKELAKTYDFSIREEESILSHFLRCNDNTQWGLINAVTRAAADVESYDRATELEVLGGRMLDMPTRDWSRIAETN